MTEMTPAVSLFLNKLYNHTCHVEIADFKSWVYQELNQLIPLDAGIWGNRSDLQNLVQQYWKDDTFLYNLPEEFMANYYDLVTRTQAPDHFHNLLQQNPHQVAVIGQAYDGRAHWQKDIYYTEHCALFGVEDVMTVISTAKPDLSQINHLISLYRKAGKEPFTEQERQLFQLIYPQLVEAFRLNVMININKDFHTNKPVGLLAVMDRFGQIVDADPDFDEFLDLDPAISQAQLRAMVKDTSGLIQHSTQKLNISIDFDNGLFFVNIRPINFYDALDTRQRKVCRYLQNGYSDEDISAELNISRRQVRYLLQSIFNCLQIANRNKLFMLLTRFGLPE